MKVSAPAGNVTELWQAKELQKQTFLSTIAASGYILRTQFNSKDGKLVADMELFHPDEDPNNLLQHEIKLNNSPGNDTHDQALTAFLTRFHDAAKEHTVGLPMQLEAILYLQLRERWDEVKDTPTPPSAKSRTTYARGAFHSPVTITTDIPKLVSVTDEALRRFSNEYPEAEINNTFDFSREDILKATAGQVQDALRETETKVDELKPESIVAALAKCEEINDAGGERVGVDTTLKDIIDPPPFDPFDL